MNTEHIANIIYSGLRRHKIDTVFDCPFEDLPRDYKSELLAIAASIPLPDPYDKLNEFKQWQVVAGGYQIVAAVDRFCKMEEANAEST